MELAVQLAGSAVAFGWGWGAGRWQHLLYVEPAFRTQRATGRRLVLIRAGVAAGGALVALLALRPGHYDIGPALLSAGFGLLLVLLASTDFERRRLPNRLTYPGVLAALAVCWAWPDRSAGDILLGGAFTIGLAGLLLGGGMLFGTVAGGLGIGDLKLMVLIGLIAGWPAAMGALFLGMLAGGVPGLVLVVGGRGRSYFSYGPYLALGGLVALLFPGWFR
ncbi:MAG: prepilin peptidase [Dehalococcoidia bacterium]|nr:prepilin peptidase [Dehalococcoidia bacterium]